MSHVDTSIGFSLRSEPAKLAVRLKEYSYDLESQTRIEIQKVLTERKAIAVIFPIIAILADSIERLVAGKWTGWYGVGKQLLFAPVVSSGIYALHYLFVRAKFERRARMIVELKFDSPVVHLTAEGQWVTFRFASGHEFVDRWDRLLRFKSVPEFTEFEFPANPPIIIPTMAIPVETIRTISQFCAAEKIPSETKR